MLSVWTEAHQNFANCFARFVVCGMVRVRDVPPRNRRHIALRYPRWRNGRRTSLRGWRGQPHAGSSPVLGILDEAVSGFGDGLFLFGARREGFDFRSGRRSGRDFPGVGTGFRVWTRMVWLPVAARPEHQVVGPPMVFAFSVVGRQGSLACLPRSGASMARSIIPTLLAATGIMRTH